MTQEEFVVFDGLKHGYDAMFCNEPVENVERELKLYDLAERVKVRIKELEQRILNDETFKKCTRKQAFMYLKTILKEFSYDTDEDYEVLECLELSRTQYGDIRSKGYKAQSFIDDLWVKSREQK